MQQQNRRRVFDRLDRERMHEAIDHIWDVSEAHADAVAKVVQALDELRLSRMKEE
jgi:hypothetical protein